MSWMAKTVCLTKISTETGLKRYFCISDYIGQNMKIVTLLVTALILMNSVVFADEPVMNEGVEQINGVNQYYRIIGEGEPFVVLHGGPGMYHDELLPFFTEFAKNHKVIFYDQRGNGRSPLAEVSEETFSTELLVDDLEEFRKFFKIDALNIIGHSWGGLLGMYYAAKYPEHVKRLILVCSAPSNTELLIASYKNQISRFTPEEWQYIQELWSSEAYKAGDPDIHNEAMRLSEGKTFYNKSLIDSYMEAAQFSKETALNAVELEDLGRDMKLSITVEEGLAGFNAPTLLINGREDFIVQEVPERIHQLIPGSKIVWIEESGHYPFIEQNTVFTDALNQFIEETD